VKKSVELYLHSHLPLSTFLDKLITKCVILECMCVYKTQEAKTVPVPAGTEPDGSRKLRVPDFKKVSRFSALRTVRHYPQEIFQVFLSVGG